MSSGKPDAVAPPKAGLLLQGNSIEINASLQSKGGKSGPEVK